MQYVHGQEACGCLSVSEESPVTQAQEFPLFDPRLRSVKTEPGLNSRWLRCGNQPDPAIGVASFFKAATTPIWFPGRNASTRTKPRGDVGARLESGSLSRQKGQLAAVPGLGGLQAV